MRWVRRGWIGVVVVVGIGSCSVACHRDSGAGDPMASASPNGTSSGHASSDASSAMLIALAEVQVRPEKNQGDPLTYPGEASVEAKVIPGAESARTAAVDVDLVVDAITPDVARIRRALDGMALDIAKCVAAQAEPGWTPWSTVLMVTARDDGAGARAKVGRTGNFVWGGGPTDCVVAALQGGMGGDARAIEVAFRVRVTTR